MVTPTPQPHWQPSSSQRSLGVMRLKQGWLSRLKISPVTWRMALFGLITLVGLVAVTGGIWMLFSLSNPDGVWEMSSLAMSTDTADSLEQSPSIATTSADVSSLGSIYVDVSGAVVKPGLYQLPRQARLADAIERAGGFSSEADSYYVSHELNVAVLLTDGQKIYIPTLEDKAYQEVVAKLVAQQNIATSETEVGQLSNLQSSQKTLLISINAASEDQLESLPGIGAKRAADIIAGRPYASLSQLVDDKVLSQAVFDDIADAIEL